MTYAGSGGLFLGLDSMSTIVHYALILSTIVHYEMSGLDRIRMMPYSKINNLA